MTGTDKRQLVRAMTQIRSSEQDGKRYLEGYVTEFDVETTLAEGQPYAWREVIRRGAFASSLAADGSIKLLHSHDTGRVIASRKMRGGKASGTLELMEDERGLKFRAEIPDTTEGRDLIVQVERGDLDGMSFGFETVRETWDDNQRKSEILEVRLFEVSVVAFPAYNKADFDLVLRSAGASDKPRQHTPDPVVAAVVARMEKEMA